MTRSPAEPRPANWTTQWGMRAPRRSREMLARCQAFVPRGRARPCARPAARALVRAAPPARASTWRSSRTSAAGARAPRAAHRTRLVRRHRPRHGVRDHVPPHVVGSCRRHRALRLPGPFPEQGPNRVHRRRCRRGARAQKKKKNAADPDKMNMMMAASTGPERPLAGCLPSLLQIGTPARPTARPARGGGGGRSSGSRN